MKTYNVRLKITKIEWEDETVEAESEELAWEAAKGKFEMDDYTGFERYQIEVTEVEEEEE